MSNAGDPKLKIWSLLLMIGSGMVFLAFFMPWWGISISVPGISKDDSTELQKQRKEDVKDVRGALSRNSSKHRRILGDEKYLELVKEFERELGTFTVIGGRRSEDPFTVSATAWGWSTGVGITAFIFSFFLLAIAIVPIFVKLLRNWIWIGYFVAAVMGLITFILSLVWYFSSPGKNVSGMLSQGVGWYPGPYLEIFGTLTILAAGVLGGVFGLLHFLKTLKQRQPATAPAKPTLEGEDEFVEE